ncbi:hypothetical protein T492DRAFT_86024 [Pavlovales sp. CCMP2436]|nr:hypothetical protein T492DRAFT_86024 [Pavlovales sp. CCMP2436]
MEGHSEACRHSTTSSLKRRDLATASPGMEIECGCTRDGGLAPPRRSRKGRAASAAGGGACAKLCCAVRLLGAGRVAGPRGGGEVEQLLADCVEVVRLPHVGRQARAQRRVGRSDHLGREGQLLARVVDCALARVRGEGAGARDGRAVGLGDHARECDDDGLIERPGEATHVRHHAEGLRGHAERGHGGVADEALARGALHVDDANHVPVEAEGGLPQLPHGREVVPARARERTYV